MKLVTVFFLIFSSMQLVFAHNHEGKKKETAEVNAPIEKAHAGKVPASLKVPHDKEHNHVPSGTGDHEHLEEHHKAHDHKAHHPEHEENK